MAEVLAADTADLYVEQRTIAETLQRSLLPRQIPSLPGLVVAVRYAPGVGGIEVGGDWYDVIPTGKGRAMLRGGRCLGARPERRHHHGLSASCHPGLCGAGNGPRIIFNGQARSISSASPRKDYFATVLSGSIDVDRHLVTLASTSTSPRS